jgi:hypothetical protein
MKSQNDKKILELKEGLLEEYGIKTDRDLMHQLNLEDDDESKKRIYAWIRYQCAFSYRKGFNDGQDELKIKILNILQ